MTDSKFGHVFDLDDALLNIEGLTDALNTLLEREKPSTPDEMRSYMAISTVTGFLYGEVQKAKTSFEALKPSDLATLGDKGDDPEPSGHAIDPADTLRMAVKGTTDLMKRRSTRRDDPEASDRAA